MTVSRLLSRLSVAHPWKWEGDFPDRSMAESRAHWLKHYFACQSSPSFRHWEQRIITVEHGQAVEMDQVKTSCAQ